VNFTFRESSCSFLEAAQGLALRAFCLFDLYQNPFGLPLGRVPADTRSEYFSNSSGVLREQGAISVSVPRLELCYITQ
jgi:hypothetical protein